MFHGGTAVTIAAVLCGLFVLWTMGPWVGGGRAMGVGERGHGESHPWGGRRSVQMSLDPVGAVGRNLGNEGRQSGQRGQGFEGIEQLKDALGVSGTGFGVAALLLLAGLFLALLFLALTGCFSAGFGLPTLLLLAGLVRFCTGESFQLGLMFTFNLGLDLLDNTGVGARRFQVHKLLLNTPTIHPWGIPEKPQNGFIANPLPCSDVPFYHFKGMFREVSQKFLRDSRQDGL
jgi:hypothetical protein